MAAVSRQRLANLTKKVLNKMPSHQSLDHLYPNVSRKSEGLHGETTLPRKRCTSARLEVGAGTPSYPQTAKITLERSIRRLLILSSVHLHTQEFVSRNENRKRSFGTAGNLVATDFRKVYLTF